MTEQHLELLSFKGGCTGLSESTHVKMPHCWKSHDMAQIFTYLDLPLFSELLRQYTGICQPLPHVQHLRFGHGQEVWRPTNWSSTTVSTAEFIYSKSSTGLPSHSVACLATGASLTADPGVASTVPARSHTFTEIDHEIISTVILLPSAESFKKGCCQLQAKVRARSTG